MGANITLIAKNSGRTVFGVRIGLWYPVSSDAVKIGAALLTATPSIAVGERRYLDKGHRVSALLSLCHNIIPLAAYWVVFCSSPSCLPGGPTPPKWSHPAAEGCLSLPSRGTFKVMRRAWPVKSLRW